MIAPGVELAPKPVVPPLDQALADLRKLKAKQLWQQNRVKEYYTELTDILRVFLAAEYRIAAIEMTSDECLEALRMNHPERKEDIRNLGLVFRTADLVKFAKGEPQPSEHEDCFRLIWRFVASHKNAEAPVPNTDVAASGTASTTENTGSPATVPDAPAAKPAPLTPQTRNDHELE